MGNVRTLAVGGISNVEATFEDFQRLFLFTHLEERCRGRAWVVVDGDAVGIAAIEKLRARYAGAWSERHFRTWSQPSFEYYYPEQFQSSVAAVLQVPDKQARREAKAALLQEVLDWIADDHTAARTAFEVSCAEVIDLLREVAVTLAERREHDR